MPNNTPLTIADVARVAGVSVSTVSRILNGKLDVAAATRDRVQQVIEDLGYIPHVQAQRLRAGKTLTLALLYPLHMNGKRLINQFELDFIIGSADVAGKGGYLFHLVTSPITSADLLNLYRSGQVDGVILMEVELNDWRVKLLQENDYPFVLIGHCADNTGISYIDYDFEQAVEIGFDILVAGGHRTIAFLTLRHELIEQDYGPAVRSMQGFERVVAKHGLQSIIREVSFDVQDVYTATLDLLETVPDLTGIVTIHDVSTVGVLRAAAEQCINIPDDLSVISVIPEHLSDLTNPPLSGLDFPSYMMGQRAAEMLIRLLNEPTSQPAQILVPPRLFTRNSIAPRKEGHDPTPLD